MLKRSPGKHGALVTTRLATRLAKPRSYSPAKSIRHEFVRIHFSFLCNVAQMFLIECDDASKNSIESTVDRGQVILNRLIVSEWERERINRWKIQTKSAFKFFSPASDFGAKKSTAIRSPLDILSLRIEETEIQYFNLELPIMSVSVLFSVFPCCVLFYAHLFVSLLFLLFVGCWLYAVEQIECIAHHRASVRWILPTKSDERFFFFQQRQQ